MAFSPNITITAAQFATEFTNNVIAVALSGAYHYGNPPPGHLVYREDLEYDSNVRAQSQPTALQTNTTITAIQVYNVLVECTRLLTRVRNFSSTYYYQSGGSLVLQQSLSGKAAFKYTFVNLPGSTFRVGSNANGSGARWTRNFAAGTTALQTLSMSGPDYFGLASNNEVQATTLNCFLVLLKDAWQARIGAATVTYRYDACHSNCHSNCHSSCHGSRSRR